MGNQDLSTLTEKLFHAYQGYDPVKPYAVAAKLNYEVEAKIAATQVKHRVGQNTLQSEMEYALDDMFLDYAREPSDSQYNHIVWVLRQVGYTPTQYPEASAYRSLNTLNQLSSDCINQ